jgi:hypothetical protein
MSQSQLMTLVTGGAQRAARNCNNMGRIGARATAPPRALNFESDRFLEQRSLCLDSIGDSEARGGLRPQSARQTGALIALDQMGQLQPEQVTPLLNPNDPIVRKTALWVISHHAEWGGAMVDVFRTWLVQRDMDDAAG